jgi:tRNA dimethylallyltransferase
MEKRKTDMITVLGHTAGGKTAFAARLAHHLGGEIISADSRQVYRGMNIGTGKDYEDYEVEGYKVPVHLIDIVDAGSEYNVYLFKRDFFGIFNHLNDRGILPVLCGGTGLYIESVLRNYRMVHVPANPELREEMEKKSREELEGILRLYGPLHNITDTVHRKRLIRAIEIARYQGELKDNASQDEMNLNSLVLGIRYDRLVRRERITKRLKDRLEHGMVEEVEGLIKQGVPEEKLDFYGLEYRYVAKYLNQKITYDEMFTSLNSAIHQFAKRQMTYFRGMERRGVKIEWLEGQLSMEEKLNKAISLYQKLKDSS